MATTATQPAAQLPEPRPPRVAPWWHTALILFLLLAPWPRWLLWRAILPDLQHMGRLTVYSTQLFFQWTLFAILYLGLRAEGTPLRDLIGGKWRSARDFWSDLRFGLLGWAANLLIVFLLVLIWVLFFKVPHVPRDLLDPQNPRDLLGYIPIALTAGFTEEVTLRGYLQRQLHALTGRPGLAFVLQATVFSLAHGYQLPAVDLLAKFLMGLSFGFMALSRRSLLPGILAHAWQDCSVGLFIVGT